jgi:hypothetical protein
MEVTEVAGGGGDGGGARAARGRSGGLVMEGGATRGRDAEVLVDWPGHCCPYHRHASRVEAVAPSFTQHQPTLLQYGIPAAGRGPGTTAGRCLDRRAPTDAPDAPLPGHAGQAHGRPQVQARTRPYRYINLYRLLSLSTIPSTSAHLRTPCRPP